MRVGILGAGPAGLYAAILIKRIEPNATIKLFEQNPKNATWGFGVVFSEKALAFLREDDPQTADLIEPHMETWNEIQVSHRGETVVIDGVGFSAIGRLRMLHLLQERAAQYDIYPVYDKRIDDLSVFDDCDFIIGADGVNSTIRSEAPQVFDEKIKTTGNWYCWYGAECSFKSLTQTFKTFKYGFINAHHYRYTSDLSTFIVECDDKTYDNAGFASMSEQNCRASCESIFADTLQGAKLVSNHSVWRRFPVLRNRQWYNGNRVLVGDALHTAHYSIGSGTRLALEDVIALVKALKANQFDIPKSFQHYQHQRETVLDKLAGAALNSAKWYENFVDHMELDPWEFAYRYITRSGRISADHLHRMSPKFVAQLEARGISIDTIG